MFRCGLKVFLSDIQSVYYYFAVCFTVYDLNGDGYISREEMFQLLKNCIVKVFNTQTVLC